MANYYEYDDKKEDLLSQLQTNYEDAKSAKQSHIEYIDEMNRIYQAIHNKDRKQSKRRPSLSIKDGQNAVDFIKAKITSDIMAGNDVMMCFPKYLPQSIRQGLDDKAEIAEALEDKAKDMKDVLEYYWKFGIDNYETVRQMADTYLREGTCVVKTNWIYDYEYKDEETVDFIPYEQYEDFRQQLKARGVKITYNGTEDEDMGGYKNLRYKPIEILEDRPTAEVVDNKNLLVDPAATEKEEARFIIEEFRMTVSDIRKLDKEYNEKTGIFENTDELINKIKDDGIPQYHNKDSVSQYLDSFNQTYNIEDAQNNYARKEILLKKYIGKYDDDDDGVAEWREIVFSNDTILSNRKIKSKVKFPYHFIYADKHPHEFWGNSPLEKLGDLQQIRTALARNIVQSAALSSIRQRAYNTNAIDNPMELKKMKENIPGANVGVNQDPRAAIMDLQSPNTNQSLYQAYNYFGVESQKALNSADNVQGIGSSASQAETATAARIAASGANTSYEYIFNSIRKGLENVFRDWSIYINELTQDNETITITTNNQGQTQRRAITGEQLKGVYDIEVVLTARGVKQNKAQQIINTFQMIQPMLKLGAVKPSTMSQLFLKLMDLWDFKDISSRINANIEQRRSQEYKQDVYKAAKQLAKQLMQDPETKEALRKDAQEMAQRMAQNQGGE